MEGGAEGCESSSLFPAGYGRQDLPSQELTELPPPSTMAVTLKCAACGAQVEFEELNSTSEVTCPGCQVKVRYRECDEQMAIPVSMALPEEFAPADLSSVADKSALLVERYKRQRRADLSATELRSAGANSSGRAMLTGIAICSSHSR